MIAPSEETESARPAAAHSLVRPKLPVGVAVEEGMPPTSTSGRGWRTALRFAQRHWLTFVWVTLWIDLPLIVMNGWELPFGITIGYRSFSRNIAIAMTLGVFLGARGMPRPRSSLTVSMGIFLTAIWLSVFVNDGRWADVRSFEYMVGLFFGTSAIATSASGRRWLFHWLGILVAFTVATEVYGNPAILQFRESLRNTMVTAHPNTVGGLFALMAPLFIGSLDDRTARGMAPFYAACAFLGAALTFSRLSIAGVCVGTGAVIVLSSVRGSPRRVATLAACAAIVVVGTIAYLSLGRSEADWQRLCIIYSSLTLFVDHWPLGIGYGVENLEPLFPERYEQLYGVRLWLFHSHNMYVDILVASGVVGALCAGWFFYALGGLARTAVRLSRNERQLRRVGCGLATMVFVFFLVGIGDMPLYHERLLFPLAIAWGLMDGWVRWVSRCSPSSATTPACS